MNWLKNVWSYLDGREKPVYIKYKYPLLKRIIYDVQRSVLLTLFLLGVISGNFIKNGANIESLWTALVMGGIGCTLFILNSIYQHYKITRKRIYTGTVLKMDEVNLNGHLYTEDAVNSMIDHFNERKSDGIPIVGQIGYPDNFSTNLGLASHKVNSFYRKDGDKNAYAEIELLDNSHGKLAKKLLDSNMAVIRPRLIGTKNEDGTLDIKEVLSFDLINKDNDAFKDIL